LECGSSAPLSNLVLLASLKIRPDLRVFFIADPANFFQIVSAAKWPRCDNAGRHYMPDPGHGRQLFLCRGVDVDFSERNLFLNVRSIRLEWTSA
jgi:hypothetical protein